MGQADKNGNHVLSYEEFCDWLRNNAPEKVSAAIKKALYSQVDIIRAAFRTWDKSGNGLISMKELGTVLKECCPSFTLKQVKMLMDLMDTDDDNHVDYDEFVDFLFHRK